MNFNFYIFGTPKGRYNQYPDDYIASTLTHLQENTEGARLVIKREMNLTHYVYTERIDESNVIGFCLIFNNARIVKPKQLIYFFRYIIEKRLVESGKIIRYNDKGSIQFVVNSFSECAKEIEKLREFINDELENNGSKYNIETLSSIYNGTKTMDTIDISASDAQIVLLTERHNTVIVNSGEGFDNGYIEKIMSSIRNQIAGANKKIVELQQENLKLTRQKKQYRYVILLSIIILGCGVGLLFLNDNLSSTKSELLQANKTISNKDSIISELNSHIDRKDREIKQEKERYSDLESEIASVAPFVITRVEIGSSDKGGSIETDFGNTLYKNRVRFFKPKFYYHGFSSGSYTIKTKWYRPSGSLITGNSSPYGYSQSNNYSIRKGSNNLELDGWGYETAGNWDTGTYKLEIWCNDKCIFVKSFTIYS